MLVAFVLCLSACGESKESDATPSQSGTVQSASQAQGTSSAAADPSKNGDGNVSESSSSKTDQQKSDGKDNSGAQTSDKDSSAQNIADNAVSQENGKSGNDSQKDLTDNGQNGESHNDPPSVIVTPDPGEKDNAEVNFNDL